MRVPIAPLPQQQNLLFSEIWILAVLISVCSYLFFVLICISLLTCVSSFHMLICHLIFDVVSIKVFGPFLNKVIFLLLDFKSSLCLLDNTPLSDMSFTNKFILFFISFFFTFYLPVGYLNIFHSPIFLLFCIILEFNLLDSFFSICCGHYIIYT